VISHAHRCIFVHIRKNAGGSIVANFLDEGEDAADRGYGTDGVLDPAWENDKYPGYLVFAVVRNPWSRFISGWRWLCRRAFDAKGNLGPDYYRTRSLRTILTELPDLLPAKSHDRRHLLWSHLDMLRDAQGQIIADRILRFESLSADFQSLCGEIGKNDSQLRHRNRTGGRPYWEYYDSETREMVGRMFREDIEHFGFKFGDPG